jgi:hypothetical protein
MSVSSILSLPAPKRPVAPPPESVSPAEAARIIGRHVNAVKSMALAEGIRHRSLPGCRILSNRADCARLAAGG